MKATRMRWTLLILAVIINLGYPAYLIRGQLSIRKNGDLVKIRTEPIDPYDPFRGRYVQLGFGETTFPLADKDLELERDDKAFLSLIIDDQNFASFDKVRKAPPLEQAYIEVKVYHTYEGSASVDLPFDRYYMNEKAAPEAERLYREQIRRTIDSTEIPSSQNNYISLRVLNGKTAIEGLYWNDTPIEQYIKEFAEPSGG